MSNMLKDRKASMRDLKKGFVFFMDMEKRDINTHVQVEKAIKQNQKTQEVDAPKMWWEDELIFRPITEWTLQRNEWLDTNESADQRPSYTPMMSNDCEGEPNDRLNSEETDEEFDWFNPEEHTDDTYFTFVNKNRQTVMPGDQVFYCYGNRTNKFLLLNYGFCFPGNRYDSFEFPLRLDIPVTELNGTMNASQIVDLEWRHRQH